MSKTIGIISKIVCDKYQQIIKEKNSLKDLEYFPKTLSIYQSYEHFLNNLRGYN